MSNRTASANKAILEAWERERQLVSEGQGTRDWTPEQQATILDPDRGKAYDDTGRAFDGQHMKSVAKYPEYQGNPDNIQFLTRSEHLEAHKGSWQTQTNWYYDPETKVFFDFSENELIPCKVIKLNYPIVKIESDNVGTVQDEPIQVDGDVYSGADPPVANTPTDAITDFRDCITTTSLPVNKTPKEKMIDGIKSVVSSAIDFFDEHPAVATAVEVIGAGLIAYGTSKAIGVMSKTATKRQPKAGSANKAIDRVVKTVIDAVSHIDINNAKSMLKQFGYTVAKSVALSDAERQAILQKVIASGTMTKEAVCAYLKFNINMHKTQGKYAEAVGKWLSDLAYVMEQL